MSYDPRVIEIHSKSSVTIQSMVVVKRQAPETSEIRGLNMLLRESER